MVLVQSICRIGRDRPVVEGYIDLLARHGGKLCCLKAGLTLPEKQKMRSVLKGCSNPIRTLHMVRVARLELTAS